jgi:glycosyltransferase involved in cell wall biosynthesis
MRPVLEQRIQPLGWKSIRFLGFKNQTELSRYYDVCDVFVLPSVHEPWGLVVNEAMNAGKAIIGSDQVGSAADLIRHGENGFVFRAGDVRALSAALRSVLSDDAYIRMGAKSLEIINRWSFKEDMDGLCQALGVPVRWVT